MFPNVMNSQLQELVRKQGFELNQAKQLSTTLQRQVTSLTGQLQCIALDLAQADKYSAASCHQWHGSSPRTPRYEPDEPSDSLEFSYGDPTIHCSPYDLFLKDLTPYYSKTKSKEFDEIGHESPHNEPLSENNKQTFNGLRFSYRSKKLSKSSDCYQDSNRGSSKA
ncbi:hypothetical protein REPUB_Repub14bG0094300 [Reevesia pubescens]